MINLTGEEKSVVFILEKNQDSLRVVLILLLVCCYGEQYNLKVKGHEIIDE